MAASVFEPLNDAAPEQAAERLPACNASHRWVEEVLAGRPYPDVGSLSSAADRAGHSLHWATHEHPFGRARLVRTAGRSAEEMLAGLRHPLGNDETRERAEVTKRLPQITRLRLERLLDG